MTFQDLKQFISTKMKMSHIYQPLLIKCLIESGGLATVRQIATMFVGYDESELQRYESTLKKMPIKVLKSHDVIEFDKKLVELKVKKMTLEQKAEIKKLCESKIQEFVMNRGLSIWDYRLLDSPVSDNLRYKVLKEAKGRCALCGATKDMVALDVDHIIPRSKKGKSIYENLQVLCAKCNRTKSNKDDTDFRDWVSKDHKKECPFCNIPKQRKIITSNEYAFAILDKYPVSPNHTLIVSKRHVEDYFDLSQKEAIAINDILRVCKKFISESYDQVKGFNVGVNSGAVAGQTISHCHIHLIPRRDGDVKDPRGGVRHVIPGKGYYSNK